MKIALFAYSRQGCRTLRRVMEQYRGEVCRAYTAARLAEDGIGPLPQPARTLYASLFDWADAMVFIGACGIAVRQIAPHVRDKRTDPAVLCIDEQGKYVIPLLSGHIGGANRMAEELAAALEALPVVTTATDINRKFSVDGWAACQGLTIDSMECAKLVSAAILERDVPLYSDFEIRGPLPPGVIQSGGGEVGICISFRTKEPFLKTLRLVPRVLHLGIGCRRGTKPAAIQSAVERVLRENCLDRRAVCCVASIDLKSREEGLLAFCRANGWPAAFYSAQELQGAKGEFASSELVRRVAGVDNVCERAAMMGAQALVVKKTVCGAVTVAVAEEKWEVRFE